ncbi:sialate O-acetylesterase [Rubritalea marina]|uniref:sialate O-acetylesterase n=1 Tax=Rubritalea marina TaxID=361055 RepID=UPI000A078413|nr:sialate O-acetylesterase [Rubritalea marina]
MKNPILKKTITLILFSIYAALSSMAASIDVSLNQSAHGSPGTNPVDISAEGDLDWGVFANSTLAPSTRMNGGAGYVNMTYVGGASDAFYNFYGENSYTWNNGDSPGTGSNNLTTNANLGADGDGVRLSFNLPSAGTYRLKFYATTSQTNLKATATLANGGVSDLATGTVPGNLGKYEFTVDFTTDSGDTLTLDVVKDGGNIILAYEAFSLSAVDVTPVPNLNIDPSFGFDNDSAAETFQLPYNNNGQEPLSVTGVTVGGADAAHFTVGAYNSSLAVGAAGNIALNFNPGAGDKVYNATLTIASNDSDAPNTVVNIAVSSGDVAQVVDLFIIAGQSNANGQGERSNLMSPAQSGPHDVMFYCSWHSDGYNAESTQNFSDWAEQTEAGYTRAYWYDNRFGNGGALGGDTAAGALGPAAWFGPEIGFAARANEINLTGNPIGIIKYGVDGSGLSTSTEVTAASDWDTTATGYRQGDAWRGFKAAISDAVTKLEADGHTPNFKGMIWWQGENGTSAAALNEFITAVRAHLASEHGLQDSANFPVVITGNNRWGAGLEAGVANPDDDIAFVNSDHYGQSNSQVHVGKSGEGSSDNTGNGTNDMYDIGEAYADALATVVEPSEVTPPPAGGDIVDVFIATGQSNAVYPMDNQYGFGRGVQAALSASGEFSNPTVVLQGDGGRPIAYWWAEFWAAGGAAYTGYDRHFFDIDGSGEGSLQAKINEIIAAGNTPRFRGVFWWQGESDGLGPYATANTTQADYQTRWDGLLAKLDADLQAAGLDHTQYKFVVNTVAESGDQINTILNAVADADPRGAIYDALNSPYHNQNIIVEAEYGNLHDYNHFAVGQANAQLFIDTFENTPTGYTITFVNVDGSQSSQSVSAGVVATPPAGVNSGNRTFTGWPTIAPATADATYTAEYTEASGDIVDLFIATGQSNAAWPWDSVNQVGTFQFGAGVQAALTASGRFTNPTVVIQGEPGMAIENWFKDGAPQWAYQKNFFGTYQGGTAALEAKIAELEGQGKTVHFKGLFWFQGEADGDGATTGVSTPDSVYIERWNGMLNELAGDVGSSDFRYVMNTVGNSGQRINNVLASITNTDSRAALFNTQVAPYRTNFADIHGYDHFAVGEANVQLYINSFVDGATPSSYEITFINVDGSTTTQSVLQGVVAIPPAGVSTPDRTFTAWPSIAPATEDTSYLAQYLLVGGSADLAVSLSQSASGAQGSTAIDLSADGTLDWGAWDGALTVPGQSMDGGIGFTSLTAIGNTSFDGGSFYGQNQYSWSNGSPTASGSTSFAGNATIAAVGDGVRLTLDVANAGTYQLKFYATTYELNLDATVRLASSGTTDTIAGNYQSNSTEKYEYTIDFTTDGADTLTLDLVKSGGNNAIFAYEAFSLAAVSVHEPVEGLGKIICIGDSLTEASATHTAGDGNWSWRYPFWKHLVDQGIAHEFVGTSTNNYDPVNPDAFSVYPDYSGQTFVNRHEGYWGLGAVHLANMAPSFLSTLKDQDETPDTAVVFLGGNDIGHDDTTTAEDVRDNLKSIVDNLQGDVGSHGNPNIRILLVSILPRFNADVNGDFTVPKAENLHYVAINGLLSTLAADESTASSEVSFLDLASTFDTAADVYYDGVHPNANGEQIEADSIYGALVGPLDSFTITFVNVNGTETNQTVAAGEIAEAPTGVSTETRNFIAWPTIEPATANATYTALYEEMVVTYTITFVNVDGSVSTQTVDAGVVATAPAGVNSGDKIFTSWPQILPAAADATYTANYQIDVGQVDISWVGGAGDNLWTSAANWSGSVLPSAGQVIAISNGQVVDIPANFFDLANDIVVNVAGNSQIDNSTAAARLYESMTFNFAAGSGMSGAYIDLLYGTLNFEDGATFTPSNIQHRGTTSYGMTLSSAGFTTLTPGALHDAGDEDWSKVTFNIDVSAYDIANGLTVDLIDYASHSAAYGASFDPVVNVTAGDSGLSGALSFEVATSKVVFTFDTSYEITFINVDGSESSQWVMTGEVAVPPAGVSDGDKIFTAWPVVAPASANATYVAQYQVDLGAVDVTWDGGAADSVWTSAANWTEDLLPAQGDVIAIANGDTVDIPANDWSLPAGITVNVAGDSQIDNSSAAARLYGGMTFNFATGSGMSGAWIDLYDGTLNFEDGATFTPSNIQHRGTTSYGLVASATGFTTLTPGALKDSGSEDWSDVTFNIDLSAYDTSHGKVLELIDYASHTAAYDGSFHPVVNVEDAGAGITGSLTFDLENSMVVFTVDTNYEISFVNVDGSVSTQTVAEGQTAAPPIGLNSGSRYFAGWPVVAPASGAVTYTAHYLELAAPADQMWLGGSGDSLWTSSSNWSSGVVPANGETLVIANGQTIDIPANDWSLPTGVTMHVVDGAQITNSAAAARLYGGMTFHFYDGSGMDGAWIDLQDGTLNFEDGATFSPSNIQHRGTTTYGIHFSSAGFTTLTPGNLYNGVDEDWSDVTFNVDLSEYELENGLVIDLIDYASHAAAYDGEFNPSVNINDGGRGIAAVLEFDVARSAVTLVIDHYLSEDGNTHHFVLDESGFITVEEDNLDGTDRSWSDITIHVDVSQYAGDLDSPIILMDYLSHDAVFDGVFNPNVVIVSGDSGLAATLYFDTANSQLVLDLFVELAWDGDAGDNSWLSASNWEGDSLPNMDDWVRVSQGAAVVDGKRDFNSLTVEAGASVTFADEFMDSNYFVVDGEIDKSGVFRLQASVLELRGSLGASLTFLDTNGALIEFHDGAAFANPNMSFEHKGQNTFSFNLSAAGFTTIQAGSLMGSGWDNVTYEVDLSDYDISNGTTVVLMDHSMHAGAYDEPFTPAAVNVYSGSSGLNGTLGFDTVTSSLVLTIVEEN